MAFSHFEAARRIHAARSEIAAALAGRVYPGESAAVERVQDAEFHLAYLAQALATGEAERFTEWLRWAAAVMVERGGSAANLHREIVELAALLQEKLPEARAGLQALLASALPSVAGPPLAGRAPADRAPLPSPAQRYLDAALHRGPQAALEVIEALLAEGMTVREIYVKVLQAAQHEIGRLWQANRLSVADEHYCTAITQRVIARLYGSLFAARKGGPVIVGACAVGELHELGARMVCDLLELDGYDTHYLGANLPAGAIVEFAAARGAHVLALSASMASQLDAVREAIELARRARPQMKVVVGGNAFNQAPALWRRIGADGWSPDGLAAGAEVQRLLPEA